MKTNPFEFYDDDFIEKWRKTSRNKLFQPKKFSWWWLVDWGIPFFFFVTSIVFLWLFISTHYDLTWIENNKDVWCLLK